MPLPPHVAAALATLRDSDARTSRADRDRAVYVADTYADRARLVIPGGARLARALVLPYLRDSLDLSAVDGALYARRRDRPAEPKPISLDAVAETLVRDLAALPQHGAPTGTAYRRLQRFATLDPAQCKAVMLDALGAALRLVPADRPTSAPADRPAPLTPAARKAAQRARDHAADLASITAAVSRFAVGAPGDRIPITDIYDAAIDWLSDAREEFEDTTDNARDYAEALADYRGRIRARRSDERSAEGDAPEAPVEPEAWPSIAARHGYPLDPRLPTRQQFYKVADSILGPRGRTESTRFYTIPSPPQEAPQMNLDRIREETAAYRDAANEAERLIRRREQLASGDYLGALTEQRETAATGTDGPIDLGAHRARKASR